jgi:membrane-associated protein
MIVANLTEPLAREPGLAPAALFCAHHPRFHRPPDTMEGINWSDLFSAMDRFLLAMVDRNVLLVYVVLFAIFFSETGLVFMAFLPGDSLLFVAGAVAAQEAGLHAGLLILVISVGAILGNTLNYQVGAWLGKKVYDGTLNWIDPVALAKTHDFYERHGGKTIVIARFVPVVRSFAPLVAGASGMEIHKFQLFNVAGAALWVVSLVGGGYLFGQVPVVRDNLGIILVVGIGAVLGPLALAAAWRLMRRLAGGRPAAGVEPRRGTVVSPSSTDRR